MQYKYSVSIANKEKNGWFVRHELLYIADEPVNVGDYLRQFKIGKKYYNLQVVGKAVDTNDNTNSRKFPELFCREVENMYTECIKLCK